ncbi:MipA/OmpV family protein [Flexibacterium corallicola]|uniref:MipA/OmpV family protein n=1 Tax=Flexibacterium corallicola TaxID=3037259 RepID=UPI00286ED139|nr:MipA/OmpV family protein [Pseudovibrio sp. M1P-2-3]
MGLSNVAASRLAVLCISIGVSQAFAKDEILLGSMTPEEMQKQYVVDIGLAGVVSNKYDGSDKYNIYPLPLIAFSRFYLPALGQVKDGVQGGVFVYPSFGYVSERKPSDGEKLRGTRKIDWAGEIGIGGGYRHDWFRGFIEVRHGFNGNTGVVGRAGLDFIYSPLEQWTFSLGPRADFADSDYMETYFGLSSSAAYGPYSADGGFKSVGLVGRVSYSVMEDITLHLQGGWDRLIGDASDSPVTETDNMFTVALGATYRFDFNLFD